MGGRLDVGDIDLVESFEVMEDLGELLGEAALFFRGEFEARQAGDVLDVDWRGSHGPGE